MTDTYLQVWAERRNGLCVLRITGELDIVTAGMLPGRVHAVLGTTRGPVLVDLSGLTFVDARGARALAAVIRALGERLAAIPSSPPNVRRVLDLLGLPLDCLSSKDRTVPVSQTSELVDRVRRARHDGSQATLDSTGTLARLASTCIRVASTRERTDLIRERGQQTVASSRAAREEIMRSRQGMAV